MKSASDLTEDQKQTVREWAKDGASLQEIQKRLTEEFSISFTYMETRFLAGDLDLEIRSEPKDEPEDADDPVDESTPEDPGDLDEPPPLHEEQDEFDDPAAEGDVPTVTVDQITKPGTIVSGRVVFSGDKGAAWALDQLGRLSLDPDDLDFRPTQEEVIAFQRELQRVAQQQGL